MKRIYYNGDIITMEKNLYTEAILIEDSLIKDIGTKNYIFSLKDSTTEFIDLKGKTLLPSFIDSHSHITALANTLSLIDLSGVTSFNVLVDTLNEFKNNKYLKDNQWILGFGYDNNLFKEKEHPTKDILDKVSTKNPILITHASGHMGVVNSKALDIFNITSNTSDPDGGVIGRFHGTTVPNGYLEENAFMQNACKMPKPDLEDLLTLLDQAQDIYLSNGITTVQDGLLKDSEFAMLKLMSDKKRLKVDIVGYIDLKNAKHLIKNNPSIVKKYKNNFKLGGYKIFLDGSPQGKTAWLTKPYINNSNNANDYSGYPIYNDEQVDFFVKTSLCENLQLLAHCNGDAACQQLINSFQSIGNVSNPEKNIRPVMIHAQTVREDQLTEMSKLNMIASFFVAHTYFWGDVHIQNLGEKRAFEISPVNAAIKNNVIYTFHQDSPVIPPNMIFTLWCAVNRISKNGITLGENEKISPLDALKAITINAAYQYFEEDIKGSIKPGKLADLVILDKNPLKVNPMNIKDINILETIKEGKSLFFANSK